MKYRFLFGMILLAPVSSFACGGLEMKSYDANNDGKVTFEEFSSKVLEMKKMQATLWTEAAANVNNRLQRQFSAMDVNHDGVIDLNNDFRALDKVVNGFIDHAESGGQEMAFNDRRDFPKIDANHDNAITFKEYFNYEQQRYKEKLEGVEAQYSEANIHKAFDTYDTNKDGVADAAEIEKQEAGERLQKCAGVLF